MRDTIYAVNGLNEWADVGENLRDQNDIRPRYWIAPQNLKKEIKQRFPNSVFHEAQKAHRGIFPKSYNERFVLDSEIIERLTPYINIALRIMDRMEINDSFHYDERIHHFYRQANYWKNALDKMEIDIVIFDSSPHVLAHYIVYAVCRISDNIGTVFLTPTACPETIYARPELHSSPEYFQTYLNDTESKDLGIPSGYQDYIQKIRTKRYNEAKPDYMKADTKFSFMNSLSNGLSKFELLNDILFENPQSYIKPPRRNIRSGITYPELIFHRKLSELKMVYLQRYYKSVTGTPDYSKKYIYTPLHYQPERTSVPEGGYYGDQILYIRLLSDVVPEDWRLYVKEHPSQFNSNQDGHQGRWRHNYDELNEINNVTLIDTSVNSFKLIDNSMAISTLTGTAGWEAVIRGVPAIVFGNAWYQDCHGVFKVKTRNELLTAVKRIRHGDAPKQDNVDQYMSVLRSVSERGYLSPKSADSGRITYEENVLGLTNAIQKVATK